MKLPSFALLPSITMLLCAAPGVLSTGCPQAGCPPCTIKEAQFTIPPAEGEIVDVVMISSGDFTGHCNGEEKPETCHLEDKESLGVLRENVEQNHALPWTSDDDDKIEVTIEVMRKTARGTVVQTPAPEVKIVDPKR